VNRLAQLRRDLGSLAKVRQVVKVAGHVRSAPDFGEQPEVANGASELLVEVSGETARAAIGVAQLPARTPVEAGLVVGVDGGLREAMT
jgi:enamine deaminase RidA (YjgF/YER057c/UK114 family)